MNKKHIFIFILFIATSIQLFAQEERDAFEMYGPPGETYTNLKEALKEPKQVYKLKLDYQVIDPKLQLKIPKLTEVQVLQLTANNLTQLPPELTSLSNLFYFVVVPFLIV